MDLYSGLHCWAWASLLSCKSGIFDVAGGYSWEQGIGEGIDSNIFTQEHDESVAEMAYNHLSF
jgi:hypothetical protein